MKYILFGACGRMGRAVAQCAKNRGDEIVCGVDPADVSPAEFAFSIFKTVKTLAKTADCAIDFSSARNVEERLLFCREKSIPIVIGTTGFCEKDRAEIQAAARVIPVFAANNFSLGVHVLCRLAKEAARLLTGFDAEIVEKHHRGKRDAPSGTALLLAESIERARGDNGRAYGRRDEGRHAGEIGFHSVRGGTVVGEHEVLFLGDGETFALSHAAQSRDVFAMGALAAAHWLVSRCAGLYGMDDLLPPSHS